MDKKSIIGLVLIFLIVIGFSYLTRPSEEELQRITAQRDSAARAEAEKAEALKAFEERQRQEDSLRMAAPRGADTLFSCEGSEMDLRLENDRLALSISTLGGRIAQATLKEFKTYSGDSLRLFYGAGNSFGFRFWSGNNPVITNDYLFIPVMESSELVAKKEGDTAKLVLHLVAGENSFIEYIYRLPYGEYMVDFDIRFHGMDGIIPSNQQFVDLEWTMRSPQQERGAKKELEYTTLCYRTPNGDYEQFAASKSEQNERVKTRLEWVGFKEQFFSAFLVGDGDFEQTDLTMRRATEEGFLRDFSALIMLPYEKGVKETYALQLYLGPNHYNTLDSYDMGFEKVVPMGGWLVGWINKYVVINVFNWLNRHIANYGLIILILTILIKVIIFPLTYRSYKSQAKMRVLKPMVDEINAKFPKPEDAMRKQQAVMGLYKSAGVNPMGGCLPMLIQFPVLIAMFRFFPASFELRQKSFLWADDLSSYDSILDLPFSIPFYGDHVSLFTLLMALSIFATSMMNFKTAGDTSKQMPGMKFMMLYMMPVMMLLWFNDYSSGLSYYYLTANLITILQTVIIRRTIDEKALLARLHQNTKKPQKKSRFMARLEKMQREQEKQLRTRGKR